MRNPSPLVRVPSGLLAVAAALACAGCQTAEKRGDSPAIRWSLASKKGEHYLSARARTKDRGNSFDQYQIELWPPFRIEATAGPPTEARAEGISPGQFGIEVDGPGGLPPSQFYFVSCQLLEQGANTFSGSHLSAPGTHGSQLFPDTLQLDMAIEHDGSTVSFFARPHGTEAWTALGTANATGQALPLRPGLGVFQITKPAEVAFDDLRVLHRGPRPGPLDDEEQGIEHLFDAGQILLGLAQRLDGRDPDPTGASDDFRAAAADLLEAEEALARTQPGGKRRRTPFEKALRAVSKARARVEQAASRLDAGRAPSSANKRCLQALVLVHDAVALLQSDDA